MADHQKILVVDDSKIQLDWLQQVLTREGFEVVTASDGKQAIRKMRTERPDLILLDVVLPDMDGLEVIRMVKAGTDAHFIPIIVFSVKADLETKLVALRIGADDFLAKPFAEAELLARCAAMLRIKRLQDELRATLEQREEESVTDWLTGLHSRRFFEERLADEFERAQRFSDPLVVIAIELDHFDRLTDGHGIHVGELVLREAGELVRAALREPDVAASYSGATFAVLLPKTHVQGALAVAECVWRDIGNKVYRDGTVDGPSAVELRVTASIGASFLPSKGITSADLLVKFAFEALEQAKRSGRNSICLYQGQDYKYEAGGA